MSTGVVSPSVAATHPQGEPDTATTQPLPRVGETCAECRAALASDQRYCLSCGAPAVSRAAMPPAAAAQSQPTAPPLPPHGHHAPNNTLALLAGVGVLLLAMGVGVLIGRAGAGSAKPAPAQIIPVNAATGAAPGATTPTPTATTPASTPSPKDGSTGKTASGSGKSIDKPAPPAAARNLRSGGSGQSYEQRSKALPDVVSTG